MKTTPLIKGKFTPEEAQEILLGMLNSKIKFHEMKCFSSMIRFGESDAASVSRIEELRLAKAQINALIEQAKDNHQPLFIEANIQIAFGPAEKTETNVRLAQSLERER